MAMNRLESFVCLQMLFITNLFLLSSNTFQAQGRHLLQTLPELPEPALPDLPAAELPEFPDFPSLPMPELPTLPGLELPPFPFFPNPQLPTISKPEVQPKQKLPALPKIDKEEPSSTEPHSSTKP